MVLPQIETENIFWAERESDIQIDRDRDKDRQKREWIKEIKMKKKSEIKKKKKILCFRIKAMVTCIFTFEKYGTSVYCIFFVSLGIKNSSFYYQNYICIEYHHGDF